MMTVALVALVSLFVFAALPLAYIVSFVARKPTSAFSIFCIITILTGWSCLALVSLYELKFELHASQSVKIAFTVFLSFARLIPSVSLLVGLQKLFALNSTRSICINISPEVLDIICKYISSPIVDDELQLLKPQRCCKSVCGNECFDQWPFFWTGWFGINVELAMLLLDACILWLSLVFIESRSARQFARHKLQALLAFLTCNISSLVFTNNTRNRWLINNNSNGNSASSSSSAVATVAAAAAAAAAALSSSPASQQQTSVELTLHAGDKIKRKSSFNLLKPTYTWNPTPFCERNKQMRVENAKVDAIIAAAAGKKSGLADHALVVSNLSKLYSGGRGTIPAVDGLSFAVSKREFFGLLGVNGAGKSTTFKMLTGELEPTSGSAYIRDADVSNARTDYLQRVGYCPQQDALIDEMTGSELLTLFARLRGIPEPQVKGVVRETLQSLGLDKMAHVNCNNYSGGNKRRLQVGLALIGSPEVIFLDEPTSGVDPASRRLMWATLIEYQRKTRSCIVMTSHSMNECESLCDRIAIMAAGQFQVLGSIQYLRTTHSQGFSLVLKVKPQTVVNTSSDANDANDANDDDDANDASDDDDDDDNDELANTRHVQQNLRIFAAKISKHLQKTLNIPEKDINLQDVHQTVLSYHIAPNNQLSWSSMLTKLELVKKELDLEDYQVTSDASLESIFLSLAEQHQQTSSSANNKHHHHSHHHPKQELECGNVVYNLSAEHKQVI